MDIHLQVLNRNWRESCRKASYNPTVERLVAERLKSENEPSQKDGGMGSAKRVKTAQDFPVE